MELALHLQQGQTQRLTMTTQLYQALEMLELESEALAEFLADKAQQNVFLRVDAGSRRNEAFSTRGPLPVTDLMPADWTFADNLKQQIRLDGGRHEASSLAIQLVDDIDSRGYLDPYSQELGTKFGCTANQYDVAVRMIQACEPQGVGARDLRECLILQLSQVATELQPLVKQLICEFLAEVAQSSIATVARRLRVPVHEVQQGVDALRRLNPRPASAFQGSLAPLLRPDLVIQRVQDSYAIFVHDGVGTFLQADPVYLKLIRQAREQETRAYLGAQWREAKWLARCVLQRSMTLQHIGEALVALQPEFLELGRRGLRAMTLRDVADFLQVHESTVSRAIRNKAVSVPAGSYELRSLFSAGLNSTAENSNIGNVSAESIKYTIKEWISGEDASHPLTDAIIADWFAELGTRVSRRTIAKYRDALSIPGAPVRKRYQGPPSADRRA